MCCLWHASLCQFKRSALTVFQNWYASLLSLLGEYWYQFIGGSSLKVHELTPNHRWCPECSFTCLFVLFLFSYISVQKLENKMPVILDRDDPCMWSKDRQITTHILYSSVWEMMINWKPNREFRIQRINHINAYQFSNH